MRKSGKGKKMDQAADDQVGLDQAAELLPRDQPRRTIPRTETADNTSPRIWTRELEVRVDRPRTSAADVGRGRRPRVKAVRGIGRGWTADVDCGSTPSADCIPRDRIWSG
ncbi:hypothetical protein F2Q70_00005747 [Brassica cretica]|uniref:Uncharacterized protein n=1 Tax=Brassica cretica TaxID=69181 RepID=A0A8S9IMN7_BRACR|nr:hypothetical protein F2Q70_00005747 [Brassica cretica]